MSNNHLTPTQTAIPPEIVTRFNKLLLTTPTPKMCDDSETLWEVYLFIKNNLVKKIQKNPIRLEKFKKLEDKFLELYGRSKTKEEECQKASGHTNKESFYFFKSTGRDDGRLFRRLKYKRWGILPRPNHKWW